MSSDSARTLRELGAETRLFRSVRGALLWYADQLGRRRRVSAGFEAHGAPISREAIDRTNATFAAVAYCLRSVHHADTRPPPVAGWGEKLLWLVAWYESTWGDGSVLAQQAGLTRWAFTRQCRRTERILRGRMEAAGLLPDAL